MKKRNDYEPRRISFGKYKGEYILMVIAEHPGYIMWCFENIHWFRLDSIEQKFYDWTAIAIKKYNCPMIFPTEALYKHVSDRNALEQLKTPIQYINLNPFIPPNTELESVLCKTGVKDGYQETNEQEPSKLWCSSLSKVAEKEINVIMTEEEVEEMVENGCTPPFAF